jgi:hypothetical protein
MILCKLVILCMTIGYFSVWAYPTFTCSSDNGSTFILEQKITPRIPADANLKVIDGSNLFGGNWLNLIEREEGRMLSKFVYQTMNGDKLYLVLTTGLGNRQCGRGVCTGDKTSIHAKLVLDDQEIDYNCY